MNWRRDLSRRGVVVPVAVIIAAVALLFYGVTFSETVQVAESAPAPTFFSAPAATFFADAGTLGPIPDHATGCNATGGTPRNVTFTVSGITGSVTNVELNSLTFGGPAHTWVGDIQGVLIAPNGASHMLFGRTLATTATSCGDSTDATGPYTFADSAAAPPNGGWWQTANLLGATASMTTGSYRSTNIGGAGATIPMPATTINSSFAGVTDANGTWTLRLQDHGGGDTGAVSAATLSITGATVPLDANVDLNGDGRTDFVVARGTTTPLSEALETGQVRPGRQYYSSLDKRPAIRNRDENAAVPAAPPIYWYANNGTGTTAVYQLGDAATDFITPEDFDGDGRDDVTVWTEAAGGVANFKVFQSTTNTVVVHTFGQTDDDPAIVGDYDGDGKADPAVFRCPGFASPAGQCFYFYKGSLNNPSGNITYVPWGFGNEGDFFPYVGDLDGDGKNDFCLQRDNPTSPGSGQFVLLRSSNGAVEYINWGLSSDFLIPGDYDGDGQTDICVRRTVGGSRQHFILHRTGATRVVTWGVTGDASAPGDYDGDGKTDLAIWRGSTDPNQNFFWVLNSNTLSVTQLEWGQCPAGNCDFPVAGWAVH